MLKCPHCNEHGISATKKLFLGPIFSSRCAKCGRSWGTSNWSLLLALVTFACAVVLIIMNNVDLLPTPYDVPVPDSVLFLLVLTIDGVIRLYVIPTRKK